MWDQPMCWEPTKAFQIQIFDIIERNNSPKGGICLLQRFHGAGTGRLGGQGCHEQLEELCSAQCPRQPQGTTGLMAKAGMADGNSTDVSHCG